MSIANEIARLQQAKADIAEAIVAKGGEVSGTIDNYAQAIEALPSGSGEHGVIMGEITIVGNVKSVQIDYDELPNEPFYASLTNNDQEAYTSGGSADRAVANNIFFNGFNYIHANTRRNTSPLLNTAFLSETPMGKTSTIFNSWGSQNFVLGTYTYKICY